MDDAARIVREGVGREAMSHIDELANQMRAEEDRLFAQRTASADRSQSLAASMTGVGSGLVVLLAGISIFLVRRSARARDAAEEQLRDNNLNLEATVDARTADLREANEEIQRFAYIVSHDLRSPLVNIMGFTSELEELRTRHFHADRYPWPGDRRRRRDRTRSSKARTSSYRKVLLKRWGSSNRRSPRWIG